MTREEAHDRIDVIITEHEIDDVYVTIINNKDYDALRIARKLLEQEPCEDCISRQAAIDLVADYDLSMGQVVKGIHALPPVMPVEKVGRWEYVQYDSNPNIGNWHCSECRTIIPHMPEETDNTPIYKWCPMCGARMEVKE